MAGHIYNYFSPHTSSCLEGKLSSIRSLGTVVTIKQYLGDYNSQPVPCLGGSTKQWGKGKEEKLYMSAMYGALVDTCQNPWGVHMITLTHFLTSPWLHCVLALTSQVRHPSGEIISSDTMHYGEGSNSSIRFSGLPLFHAAGTKCLPNNEKAKTVKGPLPLPFKSSCTSSEINTWTAFIFRTDSGI